MIGGGSWPLRWGNANRAIRLPRLDPGGHLLCAVSVTLSLAPGEYTLLPQVGGLTGEVPAVGMLHDRLESLPPVVVTRAGFEGLPPFYGLTDLPVEFRVECRRCPTGRVSDDI
jgi:hypothetical protein